MLIIFCLFKVDVKSEPTEIDWVSEFFQKRGNQDEQLKAKNLLKDIGRREEKLRTIIEKSKVDSLEPSRKRTKYSDLRVAICSIAEMLCCPPHIVGSFRHAGIDNQSFLMLFGQNYLFLLGRLLYPIFAFGSPTARKS